jgi:hypothetical protein
MMGQQAGAFVGLVEVATSNNGGHPPEFWAKRAADQIVQVADTAPMPIREQAIAFKERIAECILRNIRNAIQSDRTSIKYRLEKNGFSELSKLVDGDG